MTQRRPLIPVSQFGASRRMSDEELCEIKIRYDIFGQIPEPPHAVPPCTPRLRKLAAEAARKDLLPKVRGAIQTAQKDLEKKLLELSKLSPRTRGARRGELREELFELHYRLYHALRAYDNLMALRLLPYA